MFNRPYITAALIAASMLMTAPPAAAQGEILITQAKANAGNVTPGDTAGFPVTLSLPGAYVLGSNLNVPLNKAGLQVISHNVDIDMNGFRLNGSNAGAYGVSANHGESRIHDGVITNFKFDGIFLNDVGTNSWVVENMQIVNNGRNGINATNSYYSRYLNNSILHNDLVGIVCGFFCHVEGNNVSDNGDVGIIIKSGTVLGNTVFSNSSVGIYDHVLPTDTALGNNTVGDNNSGGTQVDAVTVLHPNRCFPAGC